MEARKFFTPGTDLDQFEPVLLNLVKLAPCEVIPDNNHITSFHQPIRSTDSAVREEYQTLYDFISIASHELKSAMAVMRGYLHLAERHLWVSLHQANLEQKRASEVVADQMHQADQQINRMNLLVSDMLDLSRIQTGRLSMQLNSQNMISLVQGIVEEQQIVNPHRIFKLKLPERAAVFVTGDADRISQVITNFLANAVKYSSADKSVEIRLEVMGQTLRVSVSDEGPGIPLDQQARIWERFQQAEGIKEASGRVTGLGLGLHISKMIIEQHQGWVGVDSIPGQGSTFWFDLPVIDES